MTQWNAAAAGTTGGAPVVPAVGSQILLGNNATLTFVAVNGQIIGGGSVAVSDENDRSIAVLIQYGGFDYLWAGDLGGGNIDNACTGRFTMTQTDVETSIIQAISPGGAFPLITAGGIDVLNVNHHGSESSTNMNWMNLSRPAVAIIATGDGQSSGWDLPRIDVVEHVVGAVPEVVGARLDYGRLGGGAVGRLDSRLSIRRTAKPPIRRLGAHPNRPVIYASVCSTLGFVKSSSVRPTSIMLPRYMNAV